MTTLKFIKKLLEIHFRLLYNEQVTWLYGQAVKTPPSHGGNPGSNPGRVTTALAVMRGYFFRIKKDLHFQVLCFLFFYHFLGDNEFLFPAIEPITYTHSFSLYDPYVLRFSEMAVICVLFLL